MIFAGVLGLLVLAEPQLEQNPQETLLLGIPVLLILQLVRGYARTRDSFSSFLSAVMALLIAPAVALLIILFGAPITSAYSTMLASAHISILAVQPLVTVHGLDTTYWEKVLSLQLPFTDLYTGLLGTALGCWLGAIPIALDWDRSWQEWPITVVVGAYVGCALGTAIGFLLAGSDEVKKARKESKKTKTVKTN